jgi:hypothetical protein
MTAKPNTRNWKDVQTAIATVAIVTTLGMWELFAAPAKTEAVETLESVVPPTEPPVAAAESTQMPQVKIMFTPAALLTTTVAQQPQVIQKKKKKNNRGGGGSPTQTHTS